MKPVLLAICLCISAFAIAQPDKIYLHNGKTVDGSVVKVNEFNIVYKYVNEDAEQTVSKYAVEKIVYGKSGRKEEVTSKIKIESVEDWKNVVIIESSAAIAGLIKTKEIKGKTSFLNLRTAAGNDSKAEEKLKREAASEGCPFILITSDKDAGLNSTQQGLGTVQSIKKGIAYKY